MSHSTRHLLAQRCRELIEHLSDGHRDDAARDALLVDLARWQAGQVEAYGRLVRRRAIDVDRVTHPSQLPAVPTDLFRFTRVAAHDAARDARVFRTSGTTSGARGMHALCDLSLYDVSARCAARLALFGRRAPLRLISLVAADSDSAESSLGYMVARFMEWFGDGRGAYAWWGALDEGALCRALDRAQSEGVATAILGTSFALQHAEERLGERRWELAPGSVLMYTGGFKGRAREVDPAAMRAALAARYGIAEGSLVGEYGMTELSSQMYETTLWSPGEPRVYRAPPWVRVAVVDAATLAPVARGEPGLLRVDDPANVDTAWAVQTSDVARQVGDQEFELLGRSPGATPRGCSLAVEEALGARGPR